MPASGLLLGRAVDRPNSFGFAADLPASPKGSLIYYEGDAPTCVIAPTGSGKSSSPCRPRNLPATVAFSASGWGYG